MEVTSPSIISTYLSHYSKSIAIDTFYLLISLFRFGPSAAFLSIILLFRTDLWSRRHHRKTGNTYIPPPCGLVKRAFYSIASFQTDLERRDERRLPTSVHTFCVQCFDTSLPLREDAFCGHCRSSSIFFERQYRPVGTFDTHGNQHEPTCCSHHPVNNKNLVQRTPRLAMIFHSDKLTKHIQSINNNNNNIIIAFKRVPFWSCETSVVFGFWMCSEIA